MLQRNDCFWYKFIHLPIRGQFYNSSHEFDGTGDYITATDSSDFAFGTGDFTAEVWFNPDDIADYRTILDART